MAYQGVGLQTTRGTATSGHVSGNASFVYQSTVMRSAPTPPSNAAAIKIDKEIALHETKRKIISEALELREALEEPLEGEERKSEEEIERLVNEFKTRREVEETRKRELLEEQESAALVAAAAQAVLISLQEEQSAEAAATIVKPTKRTRRYSSSSSSSSSTGSSSSDSDSDSGSSSSSSSSGSSSSSSSSGSSSSSSSGSSSSSSSDSSSDSEDDNNAPRKPLAAVFAADNLEELVQEAEQPEMDEAEMQRMFEQFQQQQHQGGGQGRRFAREIPAIEPDVPYVQCQACHELVSEVNSRVQNRRRKYPNTKLTEMQILDMLSEDGGVCDPVQGTGQFWSEYDVKPGHTKNSLVVERQIGQVGHCEEECKTLAKACENVLNAKDSELAELAYLKTLTPDKICFDDMIGDGRCGGPTLPDILDGEREDFEFHPKSEMDIALAEASKELRHQQQLNPDMFRDDL